MTRTLISSIALAAAMAFPGAALAQVTTIDGAVISAEDLPKVQAHCDELERLAVSGVDAGDADDDDDDAAEGDDDGDDDGEDGDDDAAGDDDGGDPPEGAPDAIAQATTTIDLTTITLEDCAAAGL